MGGNSSALKRFDAGQFIDENSVFDADPSYSLVCFTTTSFAMSDRLESEFKRRFGGVEWLKNQQAVVGKAIPVHIGERYIYYLTLRVANHYPLDMADLVSALHDMKVHAQSHRVRDIALPACCLPSVADQTYIDKLNDVFNGSSVTYHLYKS